MKIIFIVGARPQFIKLAPLSWQVKKHYHQTIIHTGQHFDKSMSEVFFTDLKIPKPKYNLGIHGGSHAVQTGEMLKSIEKVLSNEKPSLVIVFGDTNSTLAGSLASAKLGLKTIHVEAGLRSHNRLMPEELNRVLADHASDYLFAPTATALKNLESEGLSSRSYLTGDIMVDSIFYAKSIAPSNYKTNRFGTYSLLTLHRPYNVDDHNKLGKILKSVSSINKNIIFPVHPRTKKVIEKNDIRLPSNIKLINPLGYLDFIHLESNSEIIITDSGGIQKEAYILKKPCITLRPETEWLETVKSGWNKLIDLEKDEKIAQFSPPKKQPKLFGNKVSEKMIKIIDDLIVEKM